MIQVFKDEKKKMDEELSKIYLNNLLGFFTQEQLVHDIVRRDSGGRCTLDMKNVAKLNHHKFNLKLLKKVVVKWFTDNFDNNIFMYDISEDQYVRIYLRTGVGYDSD
jgi:hypothetical protein